MAQSGAPPWRTPGGFLLICFAALAPLLLLGSVGYYGDDYGWIAHAMAASGDAWNWIGSQVVDRRDAGSMYRPLYECSFLIDGLIFGRTPFLSHLLELILSAASALTIVSLARRLLDHGTAAWFAGLAWCFYPTQIEGLGWVAARGSLAATLFSLLALRLFLWEGPWIHSRVWRTIGTGLLLLLALGFKEQAAILPGILWLAVFLGIGSEEDHGGLSCATRRTLPLFLLLLAYLVWRWHLIGGLGNFYPDVPPPQILSGDYWFQRLRWLGLLLSPARGDSFGWWIRLGLGLLTLSILVRPARESEDRRLVLFLLGWSLCVLVPMHWLSVDDQDLHDSRHLIPLLAPWILLLARGVAHSSRRASFGALAFLLICASLLVHSLSIVRDAGRYEHRLITEIQRVAMLPPASPGERRTLAHYPFLFRGVHVGSTIDSALGSPWMPGLKTAPVTLYPDGMTYLLVADHLLGSKAPIMPVRRYSWDARRLVFVEEDRLDPGSLFRSPPSATELPARLEIQNSQADHLVLLVETLPRALVATLGPGPAGSIEIPTVGVIGLDPAPLLETGFADSRGRYRVVYPLPPGDRPQPLPVWFQAVVSDRDGRTRFSKAVEVRIQATRSK